MTISTFKKTSALTLSISLASLLVACGKNTKSATVENTSASNESATLLTPASVTTASVIAAADYTADLPKFEDSKADVEATLSATTTTANKMLADLIATPADKMTFKDTFVRLDELLVVLSNAQGRLDLVSSTSTKEDVRDAASEAVQALSKWNIDLSANKPLYSVLKKASSSAEIQGLKDEDKLLVSDTLKGFENNGLNLPDDQFKALVELQKELSGKETKISKNITDASAIVTFTKADLDGLTEEQLKKFKKDGVDDVYEVETKIADAYSTIMENAKNPETRKKTLTARNSRAKTENATLIQEVVALRTRIAGILGFKNWADFRISPKMAKDSKTATAFLTNLSTRLDPKFTSEKALLLEAKYPGSMPGQKPSPSQQQKQDTVGTSSSQKIESWDVSYYMAKVKKEKFNVDADELRNYFPMENTLNGMFKTYEKIFGITIIEKAAPQKWVDGLKLYAIGDKASGETLGYVYMDLYPRDGKYTHFAEFPTLMGRVNPDGTRVKPVATLVCNFPLPAEGKPSLLSHDNVTTIFHEFGHALHHTLSKAKYTRFSGTSVPGDFVEAPSQILERWAWDPTVLNTFAARYDDPSKKIPAETLKKLREADLGFVAHDYKRQLTFATLDMRMHSFEKVEDIPADLYAFTNKAFADVSYPAIEGTAFLAGFGHLFGGYDAGYYGYGWADSISADLGAQFLNAPGGYLDETVGMRLRKEIFETGGSRDVEISINKFVGRQWNTDAFFKWLGF